MIRLIYLSIRLHPRNAWRYTHKRWFSHFLFAGLRHMADTHYQTLGVARDADADTIKKAYRKPERKYHPD